MHTHEEARFLRAQPVGLQVRAPWIGVQLHHLGAFSQLCSAALHPTPPCATMFPYPRCTEGAAGRLEMRSENG